MRTLTIEFVKEKMITSLNVDAIRDITLLKENNQVVITTTDDQHILITHDSLFQAQEKFKVLTYFVHGNQKSKKIYVWSE